MPEKLGVWFPTIRTSTGTDVFTERLAKGLNDCGIRAEITWLPLRAEYVPWSVTIPTPPEWATIVHVNTWLHPRFIPKKLSVVATIHHAIHHPDALSYKGPLRAAYHKYWIAPIERRVMRRANKVTAVSEFVARAAKQTLADVPMLVIYNGIDTEIFKRGARVRGTNKPFRLLYVGSWIARKGVDLLAPIMRELGDDFELHYTGGIAAEKDKLNMPMNMKDIGRLHGDAAVADAMQSSDALLFPSRSEGFGLVAAEALACGLPVIAMEGSSVSEVVTHGLDGYLCKRDDIFSFIKAIRNIAAAESLSRADTTPPSVQNRFSSQMMLENYILQCYKRL